MAEVVMRNRVTTEYRKVEKDGSEFWDLRAQLHTDGRPMWEQTGEHDLAAFTNRLEAGRLRAEDIGDQDQPVESVVTGGGGSTVQADRGWPTPGEIEQGAGRAADMSDEELNALGGGGSITEGYPAGHPPQVDPDAASEAGVTVGGGLSGVSGDVTGGLDEDKVARVEEAQSGATESQPSAEDPSNPGSTPATDDTSGSGLGGSGSATSSNGDNYDKQSPAQLQAEVDRRNSERDPDEQIEVEGTGANGNVLKADLIKALREDDA